MTMDVSGVELRQAGIHLVVTIGAALGILVVAWASDDGLRTALLVAAPLAVFVGAIACLWRTYRSWRTGGRWQVWQGASWFLLAMFIVFLTSTGPALVG